MAEDKRYLKNNRLGEESPSDDDEGTGTTSFGGQSGQVEFREFLSNGDGKKKITPAEERHTLAIHKTINHNAVLKQKRTMDDYRLLREGKLPLEVFRQGKMGYENASHKVHLLATKAQFSGSIDKQVVEIPGLQDAKTNDEKKAELRHQPGNRNEYKEEPKFRPKPTPFS